MKKLKQRLLPAALLSIFALAGSSAFAQEQQQNVVTPPTIYAADKDRGNTDPPPPIFSLSENNEDKISVYPNPNNGSFTVKLPDLSKAGEMVITDMTGKIVWEKDLLNNNQLETFITLNNVNSGFYLLNTGKEVVKIQIF